MHHDIEGVKVTEKMKHNKAKNTWVQSPGLNRMPRGSSTEDRKARAVPYRHSAISRQLATLQSLRHILPTQHV